MGPRDHLWPIANTEGAIATAIAAYNAAGGYRWAVPTGRIGGSSLPKLAIDEQGRTFATGMFNTATAIAGQAMAAPAGRDAWVLSLDTDGALRWLQTLEGPFDLSAVTLERFNDGTVWVGGAYDSSMTAGNFNLTSGGGRDPYVAFFDPETGEVTGLETIATASSLSPSWVAVDEVNGIMWITGPHTDPLELGGRTVTGGEAYLFPSAITLP